MPAGWLDNLSTRALRNTAVLLGAVLAIAIVALVLSIGDRIHQVPQVARDAAKSQATLIAREQADHRSETTLRTSQLAACKRDQLIYRYYNGQTSREYNAALHTARSGLVTYAALSFVAKLQLKVSHLPGSANGRQRRHRIERAVGHKILRAARQIRANARAAQENARGMQYLPPTNCKRLVDHPETYKAPTSINWATHVAQEENK